MSIGYRPGLLQADPYHGLTRDELGAVLRATGHSVRELVDGEIVRFEWRENRLDASPEVDGVSVLKRFFEIYPGGTTRSTLVEGCSLSILVPWCEGDAFQIPRMVDGVPGWSVRTLESALAEVEATGRETGYPDHALIDLLDRAAEVGVGVVVGYRTGT